MILLQGSAYERGYRIGFSTYKQIPILEKVTPNVTMPGSTNKYQNFNSKTISILPLPTSVPHTLLR